MDMNGLQINELEWTLSDVFEGKYYIPFYKKHSKEIRSRLAKGLKSRCIIYELILKDIKEGALVFHRYGYILNVPYSLRAEYFTPCEKRRAFVPVSMPEKTKKQTINKCNIIGENERSFYLDYDNGNQNMMDKSSVFPISGLKAFRESEQQLLIAQKNLKAAELAFFHTKLKIQKE